MFNYNGPTRYAQLILSPPIQQVGRLAKPNPIHELPKTPFKGLTTDMRGRDDLGYAICKDFRVDSEKANLSRRLVNPYKINHKEQYPQRKPKTISSKTIPDIRPSELDLLSKMSNDNTKMLIIKMLQAKAIGQDMLGKGTVQQQSKLQVEYDLLRNRYQQLYQDYKGIDIEDKLAELIIPFKQAVKEIYGISLEELNRLNKDISVEQSVLEKVRKKLADEKITENSTTLRDFQQQQLIEEVEEKGKELDPSVIEDARKTRTIKEQKEAEAKRTAEKAEYDRLMREYNDRLLKEEADKAEVERQIKEKDEKAKIAAQTAENNKKVALLTEIEKAINDIDDIKKKIIRI